MTAVEAASRASAVAGYPSLSDEAVGNLRLSWRRAMERDDWSKGGELSLGWDRWTCWPYIAKTTYHLTFNMLLLGKMANETPAWREVYSDIALRIVNRARQYAGWYDWVEQKGLDPNRGSYPFFFYKHFIPQGMAGVYNAPGYAGNGLNSAADGILQSIVFQAVENPLTRHPYFHQHSPGVGRTYDPDPIEGNGSSNIMYRGYLLTQMALGKLISNDPFFDAPLDLVYDDEISYRYSAEDIAAGLDRQLQTPMDANGSLLAPYGLDCEVGKVFPVCMTITGMGMQLLDRINGTDYSASFDEWLDNAKRQELIAGGGEPGGPFGWVAPYFDRDIAYRMDRPEHQVPLFGTVIAVLLLTQQDPQYAERVYECVLRNHSELDDGVRRVLMSREMVGPLAIDDVFGSAAAMAYAYEVGDAQRLAEFRARHEEAYEPTFADGEFYYQYGIREPWPRGIPNEWSMLTHVGEPGSFRRLFAEPDMRRHSEPTVEGIDYPTVGVRQAWYDRDNRVLSVGITAGPGLTGTGAPTSFRVTQLPGASVRVSVDGGAFAEYKVAADGRLTLETTADEHSFRIEC
jgi:hypothetical protein